MKLHRCEVLIHSITRANSIAQHKHRTYVSRWFMRSMFGISESCSRSLNTNVFAETHYACNIEITTDSIHVFDHHFPITFPMR